MVDPVDQSVRSTQKNLIASWTWIKYFTIEGQALGGILSILDQTEYNNFNAWVCLYTECALPIQYPNIFYLIFSTSTSIRPEWQYLVSINWELGTGSCIITSHKFSPMYLALFGYQMPPLRKFIPSLSCSFKCVRMLREWTPQYLGHALPVPDLLMGPNWHNWQVGMSWD